MNDDFDYKADFDLDEFETEPDEFYAVEEEEEDDLADIDALLEAEEDDEPAHVRTAVLKKNNMVALLCIKSATRGAAICRVDPRENQPSVQLYDDPAKALEWFSKSLRSSKKNGWEVVYDGLPLRG